MVNYVVHLIRSSTVKPSPLDTLPISLLKHAVWILQLLSLTLQIDPSHTFFSICMKDGFGYRYVEETRSQRWRLQKFLTDLRPYYGVKDFGMIDPVTSQASHSSFSELLSSPIRILSQPLYEDSAYQDR